MLLSNDNNLELLVKLNGEIIDECPVTCLPAGKWDLADGLYFLYDYCADVDPSEDGEFYGQISQQLIQGVLSGQETVTVPLPEYGEISATLILESMER